MADQPLIGPQPVYPTPWELAEERGGFQIVTCAQGHEAFRAANGNLAELIVHLVNREADPGMVNLFEANASLQECSGQLAEVRAENKRLTRMVEWLARMSGAPGHDSYNGTTNRGECECGEPCVDVVAWQWHRFNVST